MSSQQAIALWKSQLGLYQRILDRVKQAVVTPLARFLPPCFEEKEQSLKIQLEMGELQNYQEYLDVIVEKVQGVRNKSTIQLADTLASQFGGGLKYWQNVLLDVGDYVNYAANLHIWHVKKVFQNHLYIDVENLSNYRRFAKLAKVYMYALTNLIKYISKYDDKKDCILKVDELYKKVKSSEDKYLSYTQHYQTLKPSQTMEDLSNNMSVHSKKNAIKDLFHFAEPKKSKQPQKTKNTLFNYNFIMGRQPSQRTSGPTKSIKTTNKQLKQQKLDQLQFFFNNIQHNCLKVQQLREQFKQKFYHTNKEVQKKNKDSTINLTSIWDKDYFFSFCGFPVQVPQNFSYIDPSFEYSHINYETASDDEYYELLGQDVDNCSQISSVSELSEGSFIVSDDYLSDDQQGKKDQNAIEPQLKKYGVFGDRWFFSKQPQTNKNKQKINQYQIMSFYKEECFPLCLELWNQDEILVNLVSGKDKKQIMQAVEEKCTHDNIKISKAKVQQFLKKNCFFIKKQTHPSKKVYFLNENQEKDRFNQGNNSKSRKSQGGGQSLFSCTQEARSEKIDNLNEQQTEEEKNQNSHLIDSKKPQHEEDKTRKSKRIAKKLERIRSHSQEN